MQRYKKIIMTQEVHGVQLLDTDEIMKLECGDVLTIGGTKNYHWYISKVRTGDLDLSIEFIKVSVPMAAELIIHKLAVPYVIEKEES